jgi:hypothetical protein
MNRSNQQMLRSYKAERRQEERNDVVQQAELYEQLAKERGLDNQATVLARLAKNVFKKSFDVLPQATKSGLTEIKDLLVKSVEDKSLSNVLKSLLLIPKSQLNAKQKVIQDDLSNPEFKKMFNETMSEILDKNPAEIEKQAVELIGGEGGEADVYDMIRKSRSSSLSSIGSAFSDAPTASTLTTAAGGVVSKEQIASMDVTYIKNWYKDNNVELPNFNGKDSNKITSYRKQFRKTLTSMGQYAG